MNFTAAASVFSSVFETHQTSPPSGTTGFIPALGTGIGVTPKSKPLLCTWPSIQGPITIMAARPLMNWFATSPWFQFTTSRETDPFSTKSVQNWSAAFAGAAVRSSSLPPFDQRNGFHFQVASSLLVAEKSSPYTGALGSLAASSVRSAQVAGGRLIPASANIFLFYKMA